MQEVGRAHEEDVQKRLAILERLQNTTEERLTKAWADLQALARQLGSGDPTALSLQAQAEIENYRDYARRLRELRSQNRETERTVKSIQEAPEMLTKEMSEDASMHSVRYAMFQAKLKREQALTKWGPSHPDVLTAALLAVLRRTFDQLVALVLLVACSPLLLALILIVRFTSKGPFLLTPRHAGCMACLSCFNMLKKTDQSICTKFGKSQYTRHLS